MIRSGDIRGQSLKSCKTGLNFARFGPEFFLHGQLSKFLEREDRDYKIEHIFRYVAKFRGDRPTEPGDLVAKKN